MHNKLEIELNKLKIYNELKIQVKKTQSSCINICLSF